MTFAAQGVHRLLLESKELALQHERVLWRLLEWHKSDPTLCHNQDTDDERLTIFHEVIIRDDDATPAAPGYLIATAGNGKVTLDWEFPPSAKPPATSTAGN